jgi:molybdopterin converting factor small subunit
VSEAWVPVLLRNLGIPARARGGLTSGMTWVGEEGPELVDFRGAAHVYDAATSRRMAADGSASGNAIEALRAEVAALHQSVRAGDAQIAANTGKVARLLDRVMPDGDAIATREVAA